jgi:hypothetical protein
LGNVEDVTIVNGDIYFVGSNNEGMACYWVNDISPEFHLPADSTLGTAKAEYVFVYENRLYIIGYVDAHYDYAEGEYLKTVCYWVDNVRYDLPGARGVSISSIYVSR